MATIGNNWFNFVPNLSKIITEDIIKIIKDQTETKTTPGTTPETTPETKLETTPGTGNDYFPDYGYMRPEPGTGNQTENKPIIEDKTGENEELTLRNWQDWAKEMQERQWQREDAIRAETQAREDNAWQRAVEDMQKAGVNPNLVNASPATSGGGITSATGIDYSPYSALMGANNEEMQRRFEEKLKEFEIEINNNFKGDENDRDRITEIIRSLITYAAMFALRK